MVIAGPVGSGEKMDYTVMGDTVNVAARLKDISVTGQIFVGASTYNYTKKHFKYNELEPASLKGKRSLLRFTNFYQGRKTFTKGFLYSDRMISSEMVGRDRELDKLSLSLLKVINGEGSIVNIIGEAGIGKSRLMAELRNREEIKRVTFLEGRALSIGKNLSFYPIVDILKNWTGIKEDDTDEQAYLKLKKNISKIHPEESEEIFPFIATMMGLNLKPEDAKRLEGIEGAALERLILKNLDTSI